MILFLVAKSEAGGFYLRKPSLALERTAERQSPGKERNIEKIVASLIPSPFSTPPFLGGSRSENAQERDFAPLLAFSVSLALSRSSPPFGLKVSLGPKERGREGKRGQTEKKKERKGPLCVTHNNHRIITPKRSQGENNNRVKASSSAYLRAYVYVLRRLFFSVVGFRFLGILPPLSPFEGARSFVWSGTARSLRPVPHPFFRRRRRRRPRDRKKREAFVPRSFASVGSPPSSLAGWRRGLAVVVVVARFWRGGGGGGWSLSLSFRPSFLQTSLRRERGPRRQVGSAIPSFSVPLPLAFVSRPPLRPPPYYSAPGHPPPPRLGRRGCRKKTVPFNAAGQSSASGLWWRWWYVSGCLRA